MNVFFYGLNFVHIKNNYVGQPVFLKKMVDEFSSKGHKCFYLYRNNVTDLDTFEELNLNAQYLPLKSNVEFKHNEFSKYTNAELKSIIDFDVQKFQMTKNVNNASTFKHNTLKILENLREYDELYNIDMFVIWGAGYIPKTINFYAKKNNKKLIVMENGYFRPFTLMIDAVGINYENSVPRDRSFYETLTIDKERYKLYLHKPEYAVADQTFRKQLLKSHDNGAPGTGITKKPSNHINNILKQEYVFVPFQLETDSQIISYSDRIKKMKELVLYVLTAVSLYNRANNTELKAVFKLHPHYLNDGEGFDLEGIKRLCKSFEKHCYLVTEGDTEEFIKKAKMIITINSTVGIEGLMHNKNVVTLGNAFYNIDGIVEHVTPQRLISQFKTLLNRKVNKSLIEKFLYYLRFEYFAEIFYVDPCNPSISKLVDQMLAINSTSCKVKGMKFTGIGNIAFDAVFRLAPSSSGNVDDYEFYLRSEQKGVSLKLKPKGINIENSEVSFTIHTKQVFYKYSDFDGYEWEIICKEKDKSDQEFKLAWNVNKPLLKKLMINGTLYNVEIRSSSIIFNKNQSTEDIQLFQKEDLDNWNAFKEAYIEDRSNYVPHVYVSGKLNVLYMPWIERATNTLIDIIDKRTNIHFTSFQYFIGINEARNRSAINGYARENKNKIKADMKEVLSTYYKNIDAVVVTLDWIAPINMFIEACNELNIPTFLIPHESVFAKQEMYYVDYVSNINCPVTKYVLTWGDLQKEIFTSRGFEKERIINVGAPKFDVYKNYKPTITKSEYFGNINFNTNKRTILFAMQPLDSQYHEADAREAQNKIIRDLIKICQEHNYQLVLRLPPALGDKLIEKGLLEKLLKYEFVYIEGLDNTPVNPMDAIYHADLVLSINSTMLFEAALLNKPSMSIKYIEFELFWANAGIPIASNFKQLSENVNRLIGTGRSSLSKEGWKWASHQLSDGEFAFNASEKIEGHMIELLQLKR